MKKSHSGKTKRFQFYDCRGYWECQEPPEAIILDPGAAKVLKLNRKPELLSDIFIFVGIMIMEIGKLETREPKHHRYPSDQFLNISNMGSIN